MTRTVPNGVIYNDWWRWWWRQTSLKKNWRCHDDLAITVNDATPCSLRAMSGEKWEEEARSCAIVDTKRNVHGWDGHVTIICCVFQPVFGGCAFEPCSKSIKNATKRQNFFRLGFIIYLVSNYYTLKASHLNRRLQKMYWWKSHNNLAD